MLTKFELYIKELNKVADNNGFVYTEECDSLLFSALIGCVPGVEVDVGAAMDSKGQWFRRPINGYPECLSCGGSKSTISRDMFIGLAWYAYVNNRLDISERVIGYALAHILIMGQGSLSRTFMTPGLLSTFAWISYRLGGPSRPWLRIIPQFEGKMVTGYQAHLSVLHILLRNRLIGKDKYKDLLEFHANRNPENALFQYAAGRVDIAYTILNNETYFPSNRLPSSKDRKAAWLWERDFGKDYQSSDKDKTLSGGDYLFVYGLLEKKF